MHWARADEMDAQRVRAPKPEKPLQKPLRPIASDRIDDRQSFPLKNPAGHRKANSRVTEMHQSHKHPQFGSPTDPSGEEPLHKLYRHNSNECEDEQGTSVPSKWHGGNRK